jgi:hypothetical protein
MKGEKKMYPLNLETLCNKIEAVNWDRSLKSMEKGIIPVWRREWVFPWENLPEGDAHADNIRRKLVSAAYTDADGQQWIRMSNKLYISKPEQPWLIAWINRLKNLGLDWKQSAACAYVTHSGVCGHPLVDGRCRFVNHNR